MKKALPNTKVTVKLRKSNYKDEWYLIIESYPLYESCRMEHSIINLNVI